MGRFFDHFLNLRLLLLEQLLADDDLDLDGAVPQHDLADEGADQLMVHRLLVADQVAVDSRKELFLQASQTFDYSSI